MSAGNAAWDELDITGADFAQAADGVAQTGALPAADAIFRCVSILNADANTDIQVSASAAGGGPNPASAYVTAFSKGPGVELRFAAHTKQTKIWVKANGAQAAYEMEVWYDIPPTAP
tara:strand:+ start:676 stop:1026 length:351 start_codon:yes stop_codon:yes gene_type:complete